MITDKEINQVADDEKQKDWNELRYADIYKDGFIDGAKWAREKVSRVDAEVKVNFADIHTINYLHKVTGLMSVLSKLIINQLKSRS